jgi:vacuolar-type H+-ATPase subunit I/STV1
MSAADDIKRLSDALASAELWEGYAGQKAAEIALHTAIDALQSERDALDERIGALLKEYAGTLAERDVLLETQRKFGALMHKTMEEQNSLLEALRELVRALDETNWSSWQTTARFHNEHERARAAIKASEGKAA